MLQHASALPSFLQVINIPSEKAMAPHSSALAWKILWTEEPGGLQSMGSLESGTTERLHFHFSLSCTGEGNSNPLQCSCLENPRDGGACWSAVYGVAQSRTRLKRLSSSTFLRLIKSLLCFGKKAGVEALLFLQKSHSFVLCTNSFRVTLCYVISDTVQSHHYVL